MQPRNAPGAPDFPRAVGAKTEQAPPRPSIGRRGPGLGISPRLAKPPRREPGGRRRGPASGRSSSESRRRSACRPGKNGGPSAPPRHSGGEAEKLPVWRTRPGAGSRTIRWRPTGAGRPQGSVFAANAITHFAANVRPRNPTRSPGGRHPRPAETPKGRHRSAPSTRGIGRVSRAGSGVNPTGPHAIKGNNPPFGHPGEVIATRGRRVGHGPSGPSAVPQQGADFPGRMP